MRTAEVVVIGGGITGMSAAYYLQRRSEEAGLRLNVTLIESDAKLGGKVGTESIDDFLLDTGSDSFMAQKPWAVELCRELGMGDEVIVPLTRRFCLLIGGKLHSVPHELVSLVPTKPEALWKASFLSFWGKLRASSEGLIRAKRDQDDESLSSFMRRRFGGEFALRFAEPLMGGVHAGHPEHMSMAAIYPMYWQMEQKHGSVTKAIFERRRQAKRDGAAAPTAPFVALRHGMASLVDRLGANLGPTEVRLGVGASRMSPTDGDRMEIGLTDGSCLRADRVLLATPSFVAADLVRQLSAGASEKLRAIPYASTAVVSLAYRREDVGNVLDGSGFLVPRGEPQPITGCTWSSNKWEGRAPEGAVLMRAFMGHAGADQVVVDSTEDQLADQAHDALARLLRISGQPLMTRVHRWLRSMPQYEVGHLRRVKAIEDDLASFPAVGLAGSAYRGVGVPDCVRQGRDAAVAILERLKGAEHAV